MRRTSDNSAFVLVIALLVLAVAAVSLAAAARSSCREAIDAAVRAGDLQLRWGVLSCKAFFLPTAELALLEEPDTSTGEIPAAVRRSISLGSMKFDVLISDEQAKANVNLLAARGSSRGLTEALRVLQSDLPRWLEIRLRPAAPKPTAEGPHPRASALGASAPMAYSSFDQLFAVDHPSQLAPADRPQAHITDRVTCWGDGRVNFKRAKRCVLREVLGGVLDESRIDRLMEIRRLRPDCTLGEALRQLELTREQVSLAGRLLTDTSWSHSVWIIAEGPTRNWHRFYVACDGWLGNGPSEWSFAW